MNIFNNGYAPTAEDEHRAKLRQHFEGEIGKPESAKFSDLPDPPYPINEVAHWVWSEMTSPQKDIAIVTAWLLCAAFAGRKDSFLDNPPVMAVTMLAKNGTGKDSAKRCLEKICRALAQTGMDPNQAYMFHRVAPSHGTDQMRLDELQIVSGLRITSEAGLSRQSKAGDSANVRAALLQNIAQAAYSRRSYVKTKGATDFPYGVSVSVLDESTAETFLDGNAGAVASGHVARTLSLRIDAANVGETDFLSNGAPVPANVVQIFRCLAVEALREEPLECEAGISASPVEHEQRYAPDSAVVDEVKRLAREDTEFRRAKGGDEADLDWGQKVRTPQLVFRLALIAARTRALVQGQGAFVTKPDFDAAEAFVKECRRTELANSCDYDDACTRATATLHKWGLRLLQAEPGATWKKLAHSSDHAERRIRYSVVSKWGQSAPLKAIREMANARGVTPKEAFELVALEGQSLEYWRFEGDAGLVFT